MKRADDLPPRPDLQTGEPRPPAAPLVESVGESTYLTDQEDSTKTKPKPPADRGPVIEWFQENQRSAIRAFFVGFFFIVIALTLKQWSFWWMTLWWAWLCGPVLLGVILYVWTRRAAIAAGVDWYKNGKHWVDTYDLKSVKVEAGPGKFNLALRDRSSRAVVTPCLTIEKNRKLWDLVYNGIVHSVKDHPVETNKASRQYLDLPL